MDVDDIHELRRLAQAVSSDLQWLDEYSAFAEIADGFIEAAVRDLCPEDNFPSWAAEYSFQINTEIFPGRMRSSSALRRIPAYNYDTDGRILAHGGDSGLRVEISAPSYLADILKIRMFPPGVNMGHYGAKKATLKIWHPGPLRDRAHASQLLRRVSDSLSFVLDKKYSSGFRLSRRPPWPIDAPEPRRAGQRHAPVIHSVPIDMEYSEDALRYYWLGRQATSVPSLEYVSFYQILEYNFSRFVQAEAVDFLRQQLADPGFDPARDDMMAQIAASTAAKYNSRSKLPSLRATLHACLTTESLTAFIDADDDLKSHLAKPNTFRGVARVTTDGDPKKLIDRAAERIDAIRNQLVHAEQAVREGQTAPILLPGSKQMGYLAEDVKLIRFAAQSVLDATSVPLTAEARKASFTDSSSR